MTRDTSIRIDILRTVLIWGIVIVHVPPSFEIPSPRLIELSAFTYLKVLLEHTVFRSTVPTLSMISGFLLFLAYEKIGYRELVAKKARTLLVPLIAWNLPLAVVVLLLQKHGAVGHAFRLTLHPFDPFVFTNAVFSLTEAPADFPLAFIRDLFVCILASPLVAWSLRRTPFLGLAVVAALGFTTVQTYVLMREQILFFFYVGGLIATRGWSLAFVDRRRVLLGATTALGCVLVASYAFGHLNAPGPGQFKHLLDALRLVAPLAFWGLAGALVSSRTGAWLAQCARYSFFTFCAHGPILVAMWIAWKAGFGGELDATYRLFYFAAPIVTIVLCIVGYELLAMVSPSVLSVLSGNRERKRAVVTDGPATPTVIAVTSQATDRAPRRRQRS